MPDSSLSPESQPNQNIPSENQNQEQDIVRLPDEIEILLEDVPEQQRQAVRAVIVGISTQRIWRGPYPPPDILKQYNDAFPNGAERIFLEGQKQTNHRIAMEQQIVPSKIKLNTRGQLFGFVLAIAFLLVAGFLIYEGHETAGTVLGTIDLLGLVIVFVLGQQPNKKMTEEQREQ